MLEAKNIDEGRCECGKLLFKRTKRGIEFKCARCKRIHFVPLDRLDFEYHSLCPVQDISETVAPEARDRESNARKRKEEMYCVEK